MDGWDIALLIFAGYVAALGLARLMIRRRNQLVDELLEQVEREKEAKEAAQQKEKEAERARRARAA